MATMSASQAKRQERKKAGTPAGIGDAFLGKVPPHSTEAELSVIGGVLLHNSTLDVVSDMVRPQDFYSEAHELIFQSILDLNLAGKPVDLITLGESLKERGELESVGGLSYLASILDSVPTAANIESHARVVAEKAAVRSCLGAALDILEKGYGDYGDAETYLDESEQSVFEATRRRGETRLQNIYTAIKTTFDEIERLQKAKTDITGVPTGYPQLDRITTGLQPADLVIVAGRPAMGKTALALNMATNAVKQAGTGVVIFSLEMSVPQLMRRLLSSEASVPSHKLRVPRRLEDADFVRLIDAADRFHKAPIYLDDSPEINVLEIRSRARRLKAKADIGLIIIDYLQIMRPVRASRGDTSREREIAEITRSLKALSKEINVPVVCLSQLNRGPENRQDKRPQLADLRESGAIEQDADLILFLYREAAYNHDTPDNTAEVIVGKNRNGPVGTLKLMFHKEFTRFDNMEENVIYEQIPGEETQFATEEDVREMNSLLPPDEGEDTEGGAPF
jgi:replicative DNA helicase